MSHKKLMIVAGCALASLQGLLPTNAYAIGNGVPFVFREGLVPAMAHPVLADSMDFTYHSCVDFTAPGVFTERGYLWISSFQDVAGVVDSQINYFLANGYHIYARYTYSGEECRLDETCNVNRERRSYGVTGGAFQLFLDPLSDTALGIGQCQVNVAGIADDVLLGLSNEVTLGQKSETNDVANGDFEVRFHDWIFTNAGQALFRDVNLAPLVVETLVFNGNVTLLGGPLANDHLPSGSGNLYWLVQD